MKIRRSNDLDRNDILYIHQKAFGNKRGDVIAKLVDDLLDDVTAKPILSLVAIEDDKMLGHVLFTKVSVAQKAPFLSARILAPLAVRPDTQKNVIGQKLINEGLNQLKAVGVNLVFVLGHPSYYPRCGFKPAGSQGFEAPYPIPEEHSAAWMVQELNGSFVGKIQGKIECSKVLNEPQHWRE